MVPRVLSDLSVLTCSIVTKKAHEAKDLVCCFWSLDLQLIQIDLMTHSEPCFNYYVALSV